MKIAQKTKNRNKKNVTWNVQLHRQQVSCQGFWQIVPNPNIEKYAIFALSEETFRRRPDCQTFPISYFSTFVFD